MIFKLFFRWIFGLHLLFFALLYSCTSGHKVMNLQNGDILFCSYYIDGLTKAIDEVTQTQKATHYSHVGIVSIEDQDTFVIHASTKKGVAKDLLSGFIASENTSHIDVYRLHPEFLTSIDSVLKVANTLIGLPYNYSYKMDDSGYYCSQLLYHLFEKQDVFLLNPMTFKNSESGEFNEVWIQYYADMNLKIPEGEPGCNPNGLASSENLRKIFRLK